jgi:hypothetical protein
LIASGQSPEAASDVELVSLVKIQRDSHAVTELVHRHTGAYISIINQYEAYPDFRARVNIPDLKEDKFFSIYSCALSYDPNRGMQFGTYVAEMTKFKCSTLIKRGKDNVELDEMTLPPSTDNVTLTAEKDSALEVALDEVKHTKDPVFRKIFKMRHGGKKTKTWRAIGEAVGLTHEGARKVYAKHMGLIKERARS